MPWPCLADFGSLGRELLGELLDLAPGASVLELSVASRRVRDAVDECRVTTTEGPWRFPKGMIVPWRFLGLGDVKKLPCVTLCCEVEFPHEQELRNFFQAARQLADDTVDGQVTFARFTFDPQDVAHLFYGEDYSNANWCGTEQTAELVFNGCHMTCSLDGHRDEADDVPWINLSVDQDSSAENPLICCSSLLLPQLRMNSSCGNIYECHDLDAESPLTDLVQRSLPLPMFLGVKGLD